MSTNQPENDSIAGTVTDESGQALPGVNINIQNIEGGPAKESYTNTRGEYRVMNLSFGQYKLTYVMTGFKTTTREVRLGVGEPTKVVDVMMAIDPVSE